MDATIERTARMNQERAQALYESYQSLAARCGLAKKDAIKMIAQGKVAPEEFARVCAARCAEAKPWINLLGLHDEFHRHAPPAPASSSKDDADIYVEDCCRVLAGIVQRMPDESIRCAAKNATTRFGVYFTGKIYHTSIKDAVAFVSGAASALPHISSRTLRQAGIHLGLEQSANDTSGAFGGLQKILHALSDKNKTYDMGERVRNLVRDGAQEGVELAKAMRAQSNVSAQPLDPRLPQLLLPSGSAYISVSPLGSGHLSHLLGEAANAVDKRQEDQLLVGATDAAALIAAPLQPAIAEMAAQASTLDGMLTKLKREKKSKTEQPIGTKTAPGAKLSPHKLRRIMLPMSDKKQNFTSYGDSAHLARVLYFESPSQQSHSMSVHRFLRRSWVPFITRDLIKRALEQIAQMDNSRDGSGVYAASASVGAVRAQATGAVAEIARKAHKQAMEIHEAIAVFDFGGQPDGATEIDSDMLAQARGHEPSALDLSILEGSFDAAYCEALAQKLLDVLYHSSALGESRMNPLLKEPAAVRRVLAAIEKTLGDLT